MGSELPHVIGEPQGGEKTLLSCKVCSILGPKQHKKHLCLVTVTQQEKQRWRKWPWCQSKGNSPLFPCRSGFPRETQFFPVLSPAGVLARPQPCRVLPCAPALLRCARGALRCGADTPVLAHRFTTYSSLFSNLGIALNSSYPRLDMQLRIHADTQIYDFSAFEHFYLKASV